MVLSGEQGGDVVPAAVPDGGKELLEGGPHGRGLAHANEVRGGPYVLGGELGGQVTGEGGQHLVVPDASPTDQIGDKLESLGLAEPTNTPRDGATAAPATPAAPR